MLGLAFLLVIFLYLAVICVAVVDIAVFTTRRRWPTFLRVLTALAVLLLFTVPIFWDWLPTRTAHSDYCAREAGVHRFKTFGQWEAEHPLAAQGVRSYTRQERRARHLSSFVLNSRFELKVRNDGPISFNLFKHSTFLFDRETGEILADYVDFSAGYGNWLEGGSKYRSAWKIWLVQPNCPGSTAARSRFFATTETFKVAEAAESPALPTPPRRGPRTRISVARRQP